MNRRHALVVHLRMPAFDRDSGSQDVDNAIRFLLDRGWRVTFLSKDGEREVEHRHAERLRRAGVATFAGFEWLDKVLRSNQPDLVLVAFWQLAEQVVPAARELAPNARVVVNSMDVHFLRDARRAFASKAPLGDGFGRDAARELNVYHAADAVVAVSDQERDLLANFLGADRVFTLPIAESVERAPHRLDERRGMFFVGNFRHVPNQEAVRHLVRDVLPLLDPALLERHPLTVVGNWLDRVDLGIDPDTPGLRLVGWVPDLLPYLTRARVAVVPLLHGAGVKRKVLQAMMAGTPVVTTPVGAEGLDIVHGTHALVATGAPDLAAGITRLLTDDDTWRRMADAGAEHVAARHGLEVVRARFDQIVDRVLDTPPRTADGAASALAAEVRRRVQLLAEPGSAVLVASGGDDGLVDVPTHVCWHFPQSREGGWAGFDPVDGLAAISHLEAQRQRGARWFVLPRTAFSWRHRYPELLAHLEATGRRVHADEHLAVYDLAPQARPAVVLGPLPAARVLVVGTYRAHRAGPPPDLLAELGSSARLAVEQRWGPDVDAPAREEVATGDHDVVVHVRDDAVLPGGFLDDLVATMLALDVERLQPTHRNGPDGGPPVTERQLGTVAREVDGPTSLPVLAVRRGAAPTGPTALCDTVSVGLREPLLPSPGAEALSYVRRVWVRGPDGRPVVVARPEPEAPPDISVLIATRDRPELLRDCLASFADQTLDRDRYEVVVVDDGSEDPAATATVVEKFANELQIVSLRIDHGGRSAAKNHAVLLSRAPIVLFFDDDDRAERDYLERHLARHRARPAEGIAVLGHTDWAPELELTPVMRYVTDVDRMLFAYERLRDGQELDWRGFWEGRISCKRSLLARHGLHDQRLAYSIDVELGWRLARHGLRVVYDAEARSVMARGIDVDDFCERTRAKGRASALIAGLHPGTDIARKLHAADAAQRWEKDRFAEDRLRREVAALEQRVRAGQPVEERLHAAYRQLFGLMREKGAAEVSEGPEPGGSSPQPVVTPWPGHDLEPVADGTPPEHATPDPVLTVTVPVWSRTAELAEMARATIERVWEVARVPTEVVVIDNGSPVQVPLPAKVHRYPENKGVATAWNTGIRLASAPVVVVLNSDCRVEPGWDEALLEAVSDGRRIAFPYTDHCDGRGFVQPDQGGTAGWCFMLTKEVYEEVGPFDEWFNPAFLEDTDYWHRAWQLGIELTPVPAARVVHARRTTASTHPRVDWLLQGHRYKYGWKHGVDPHRAPPYYSRAIEEYHGRGRPPQGEERGVGVE